MIRYFSVRHNWQVLVIGLKTLPLASFFHEISYGAFCFFRSQIWPLKVVAVSLILKSDMCLLYLVLKVPPVRPVSTVSVSVLVTVAWYTNSVVWHWPYRGHTPVQYLYCVSVDYLMQNMGRGEAPIHVDTFIE